MTPAAIRDDNGRPLLSWRVTILPYLERQTLLEKFDLHERWNSFHNSRLLGEEPKFYISPQASENFSGETNVVGIVDDGTVLTRDGISDAADLLEGGSMKIMAVELAGTGIAWSEPRDITIDEFIAATRRSRSDTGLRPLYSGGVVCMFINGMVRFVPTDTPPEVLRALCTRNSEINVDTSGWY